MKTILASRVLFGAVAATVGYFTGRMLTKGDLEAEQRYVHRLRLRLDIGDGRGFTVWTETDELSNAPSDAQVFTIDRNAAELVFGDGAHGRRPPTTADCVGVAYRARAG